MELIQNCLKLLHLVVFISILPTVLFTPCDARFMVNMWKQKGLNLHESPMTELKLTDNVISNDEPYTFNSPFDSLSPLPQPGLSPPFTPPSTSNPLPSPMSFSYSPPANPPEHGFTPPSMFPSPPQHQPNPPKLGPTPSPPKNVPGQPIYAPPMLNPPSPPPKGPGSGGGSSVWCVAKPTVPDSILQAAMDYACGCGADCKSIQPNQPCFQPNTLISHASYAFDSYWQNTKGHGGTCDFGGTAMLVTVDPSFDKCQFSYK